MARLQRINPDTFVLLITAYATVENAVQAFQRGAHDYLMKPILLDEVAAKIRRLLAHRDLYLENQWLRRELNRAFNVDHIVGDSPAMKQVFEMVPQAGADALDGAADRRERHRQGADRAGHSRRHGRPGRQRRSLSSR